jgi:hypothetical protein
MLTLKVITTDRDGQVETHIYYGESMSHTERIIKASEMKKFTGASFIGSIINESSEQQFVSCDVIITGKDVSGNHRLLILPASECFIMENGKTVDTFSSDFK